MVWNPWSRFAGSLKELRCGLEIIFYCSQVCITYWRHNTSLKILQHQSNMESNYPYWIRLYQITYNYKSMHSNLLKTVEKVNKTAKHKHRPVQNSGQERGNCDGHSKVSMQRMSVNFYNCYMNIKICYN